MDFLILDDSPTMRRIIKNTLSGLGYTSVEEAEDGKHAQKIILGRPIPFDFIITDWNMPNMNGLEFVNWYRKEHSPDKQTPILMVTTRGNKADILEAMQARVNSYIIKPFTPPVMKEKINAILTSVE